MMALMVAPKAAAAPSDADISCVYVCVPHSPENAVRNSDK